mmetsp:Transcript_148435/g.413546  ORF Transcript_148435/g.413546 Transcript_148435/m.413546 type:complete len:220 (+) Transcript_148435:302-961(+)
MAGGHPQQDLPQVPLASRPQLPAISLQAVQPGQDLCEVLRQFRSLLGPHRRSGRAVPVHPVPDSRQGLAEELQPSLKAGPAALDLLQDGRIHLGHTGFDVTEVLANRPPELLQERRCGLRAGAAPVGLLPLLGTATAGATDGVQQYRTGAAELLEQHGEVRVLRACRTGGLLASRRPRHPPQGLHLGVNLLDLPADVREIGVGRACKALAQYGGLRLHV